MLLPQTHPFLWFNIFKYLTTSYMYIKSFSSLHSLLIILLKQWNPGTILHSKLSYFPVFCVYVTQSLKRAAYRSMGNISVAIPMKKKKPLPQPPYLSHREGWGLMSPFPFHDEMLDPNFYRFCAGHQRCWVWECISHVMPGKHDFKAHLPNFLLLHSVMFPELGVGREKGR